MPVRYTFRYVLVCALFFLSARPASAQDTLSGIINDYSKVLEIDTCAAQLQLADATPFQEGDTLLLIQMQGAAINQNNTNSFGQITELNSAGRYERIVIAALNGNLATLENGLLYDYEVSGQVQVVSFPYYEQAVVTAPLTAQAWDGNTGGVLALSAGRLELQADIDVSGTGFRGGDAAIDYDGSCTWFTTFDNFRYEPGSIRSGRKGEGIAGTLANWPRGKGPAANGGGGGNDHNAGGGGGAQLTAGGNGGENDNPSVFGCQGGHPGRGGRALPATEERLFAGGGGGAGHGNNNVATDGGNGGGILLLLAAEINSNGAALRANGRDADTANGDGAGGGGAGGTIVLRAGNDNPNILIEARGGNGGNANNGNAEQCFGPGGGGSGGRLLRDGLASAAVLLGGGNPGFSINSAECPAGPNGATSGQAGVEAQLPELPLSNQPLPEAPTVSLPADTLFSCGDEALSISADVAGSASQLQWEADSGDGNGFGPLNEGALFSGTESATLSIADPSAAAGYRFRLRVESGCFGPVVSSEVLLSVVPAPLAGFSFEVDGLQVTFNNEGAADSFFWEFGDGSSSTAVSPVHDYPEGGIYTVTLLAVNEACGDTVSVSQEVALQQLPQAAASASTNAGCAPLSVLFTSQSPAAEDYAWLFEGGNPASATDAEVEVAYNSPGTYDVSLVVSNSVGADTVLYEDWITVQGVPMAGFAFSANGLEASFTHMATNADTYSWDFGDGNTSDESNPVHLYGSPGLYEVVLEVSNECGSAISVEEVLVGTAPVPAFSIENSSAGCVPKTVLFTNTTTGTYDSLRWSFPGGDPASATAESPVVEYAQPGTYDVELTIYSAFGSLVIEQNEAVTVYPRPNPGFTFSIDGLTVTFDNTSAQAENYVWNFDDGNTSTEESPVHTYSEPGFYEITLNAIFGTCARSVTESLFLQPNSSRSTEVSGAVYLAPNPSDGQLCLIGGLRRFKRASWDLLSATGAPLRSGLLNNDPCWDWRELPAGQYWLSIRSEQERLVLPVVIR